MRRVQPRTRLSLTSPCSAILRGVGLGPHLNKMVSEKRGYRKLTPEPRSDCACALRPLCISFS